MKQKIRKQTKPASRKPPAVSHDLSIISPRIVLQGNREALVEGCKKVLIYDENMVRLQARKMDVCFYGSRFDMQTINAENVIITGNFDRIEYIFA